MPTFSSPPLITACDTPDRLPEAAQPADLVCRIEGKSYVNAPSGSDEMAGSSITLLTLGGGLGVENLEKWAVLGAPGLTGGEGDGTVYLKEANVASGAWTTTTPDDVLVAPNVCSSTTDPFCNFGWSVVALDIQACTEDTTTSPPSTYGCGQELLVGAPSVGHTGSTGRVLWYRQRTSVNGRWLELGGEVPVPSAVVGGDEFGFAIAGQADPPDAAAPWDVTPAPTPWVAISAPGTWADTGTVYAFEIDPSLADPFSSSTPVSLNGALGAQCTSPGSRCGEGLLVLDFDNDSIQDLVVGAPAWAGPTSVQRGAAFAYHGTGTSSIVELDSTLGFLNDDAIYGRYSSSVPAPGPYDDRFGASMARVTIEGAPNEAVVIGAPGWDGVDYAQPDQGAVCWFWYDPDATYVWYENCDYDPTSVAGDMFGSAVAAGNFNLTNSMGLVDDVYGPRSEVAVGSPYRAGDKGTVRVFSSEDMSVDLSAALVDLDFPVGEVAGDHFGTSLATGYVEASFWQDLLIASPGRGSTEDGAATLTRAEAVSSCHPAEVEGEYEMYDYADNLVRIRIWRDEAHTWFLFVDDFQLYLWNNGGNGTGTNPFCMAGDIGPATGTFYSTDLTILAGTVLIAPEQWPCGTETFKVFTEVPADYLIGAIADQVGYPGTTVLGQRVKVTLTEAPPRGVDLFLDIEDLDNDLLHLGPNDCAVANKVPGPYYSGDHPTPQTWQLTLVDGLCEGA